MSDKFTVEQVERFESDLCEVIWDGKGSIHNNELRAKYQDRIADMLHAYAARLREDSEEIKRLTTERDELRKKLDASLLGENLRAIVAEDTNVLMDEILDDKKQIKELMAERDAWRKLVVEHNAQMQDYCESRACDSDMRQCGECPVRVFGIDVAPELEQSS